MAAIALLAVGVGVWSIPQTVQFESDAVAPESDAEVVAQKAEVPAGQELERGSELEEAAVLAMDDDIDGASAEGVEPAKTAARPERRPASRAKKRRGAFGNQSAPAARRAAAPEAATAGVVASDEAAGGAAPDARVAAVAEKSVAAESKGDDRARTRSDCEAKLAAFEKRLSEDSSYAPNPEEQLAMGLCYQTLGNTDRARQWLERAAERAETKRRAKQALRTLSSK